MSGRDWTAYYNEDGEPWAIFVHGHVDLRTIKSIACKQEMKAAFERACGDADDWFNGNLEVGHWWIRSEDDRKNEDANSEYPWHFCKKGDDGAIPITGAKFA